MVEWEILGRLTVDVGISKSFKIQTKLVRNFIWDPASNTSNSIILYICWNWRGYLCLDLCYLDTPTSIWYLSLDIINNSCYDYKLWLAHHLGLLAFTMYQDGRWSASTRQGGSKDDVGSANRQCWSMSERGGMVGNAPKITYACYLARCCVVTLPRTLLLLAKHQSFFFYLPTLALSWLKVFLMRSLVRENSVLFWHWRMAVSEICY